MMLHTRFYGTPFVGSAAEWAALGVLLFVTGVALGMGREEGQFWRTLDQVGPGLMTALVLLAAGSAGALGTMFALSIELF
jgi:hypothetical protein